MATSESEKMVAVSQAGAQAAAQSDTPEQMEADASRAMKEKRDEVGFQHLSDEDIDKIAKLFADRAISELETRGAFDRPPERVEAAETPTVEPPPRESAGPAAEPPAAPAPQPRSWAQRFMGA